MKIIKKWWFWVIVVLLVLIIISFLLPTITKIPYYSLAFTSSCEKQCIKQGFVSSKCVSFPSIYPANENPCGNNGKDIGQTSDCRNYCNKAGGACLECCCYN